MPGLLIAFEGLDQSGKQTQAERLRDALTASGRHVRLLSFPNHATPIGHEIRLALAGDRHYAAEVLQLLYVANRYESRSDIAADLGRGTIVLCDRYIASSVAYGEAQGLDPSWLAAVQQRLPQPDLTILLDILPEVSARRKQMGRDRFEQDLALLARVRESYLRQAAAGGWVRLDADRPRDVVAADVASTVSHRLMSPASGRHQP